MIEANLDQKTIDILLTCRKAIDDHRIRKAEYRTTQELVAKDSLFTAAAKTIAYDTMQSGFTESKDTYLAVLLQNGFETVDAFYKFNDNLCLSALKEYFPYKKIYEYECDLCEGYKDTPNCFAQFGNGSCFASNHPDTTDTHWLTVLHFWRSTGLDANGKTRMGDICSYVDGDKFYFCPKGHGVEHTLISMPPFDLCWK